MRTCLPESQMWLSNLPVRQWCVTPLYLEVDRTGFEADPAGPSGIQFWGTSFVAGPQGELLVKAPVEEQGFYLQLPPPQEDLLKEHRAAQLKAKASET